MFPNFDSRDNLLEHHYIDGKKIYGSKLQTHFVAKLVYNSCSRPNQKHSFHRDVLPDLRLNPFPPFCDDHLLF